MPVATTGMALILDTAQFTKGLQTYISGQAKIRQTTSQTAAFISGTYSPTMQTLDKGLNAISGTAIVAAKGIGLAAGAVTGLYFGLNKLAGEGPMIEGLRMAFSGLGADINEMRKATGGMVADTELIKKYNLAYQLVGKTFADQLPSAMNMLQKVAMSTGQSMDYLMNSLVLAVGRGSRLIADNLAITVDWDLAYKDFAKTVGKAQDALSESEKQTARMNQVMERLAVNTAHMPDLMGTAAGGAMSFGAAVQNAKDDLAVALIPALRAAQIPLQDFAETAEEVFRSKEFRENVGKMAELIEKFATALININPELLKWTGILIGGSIAANKLYDAGMKAIIIWKAFSLWLASAAVPSWLLATEALEAMGMAGLAAKAGVGAGLGLTAAAIVAPIVAAATAQRLWNEELRKFQAIRDDISKGAKSYEDYVNRMRVAIAKEAEESRNLWNVRLFGMTDKWIKSQEEATIKSRAIWANFIREVDSDIQIVDQHERGNTRRFTDFLSQMRAELQRDISLFGELGDAIGLAVQTADFSKVIAETEGAAGRFEQAIEKVARDAGLAALEAQFNAEQAQLKSRADFESEYRRLIASGRVGEANELKKRYDAQQEEAKRTLDVQQQLQERAIIQQKLTAARAYQEEIQALRDQASLVMIEQIRKAADEEKITQTAAATAIQHVYTNASDMVKAQGEVIQAAVDIVEAIAVSGEAGVKAVFDRTAAYFDERALEAQAKVDQYTSELAGKQITYPTVFGGIDTTAYSTMEDAARTHAETMAEIEEQAASQRFDAQFSYGLQQLIAQQDFDRQRAGLLAAGKKDEADALERGFAESQAISERGYSVDAQLAERGMIQQQIVRQAAYVAQLEEQKAQFYREWYQIIAAVKVYGHIEADKQEALLEIIVEAGGERLRRELDIDEASLKQQKEYGDATLDNYWTLYQSIELAVTEGLAAAKAKLDEMKTELAGFAIDLPILPAYDAKDYGIKVGQVAKEATESATKALAEVVSDVQKGVEAATQAIYQLARFRYPAGLEEGIKRYENFVVRMVKVTYSAVSRILRDYGDEGEKVLPAVQAAASQFNEALSVVKGTFEALQALTPSAGPSFGFPEDLAEGIIRYENLVVRLTKTLYSAAERMGQDYPEGTEALRKAQEAAAQFMPIMETVGASVDALQKILAYQTGNLPAVIDVFSSDFLYLTKRMGDLANLIGDDALENALLFEDNASRIAAAIQAGVDSIQGTATMMVGVDFLKINQGLMGAALGFMQGSVQVSSGTQINNYSFSFGDVALSGGLQLEQFKSEVVDAVVEATRR